MCVCVCVWSVSVCYVDCECVWGVWGGDKELNVSNHLIHLTNHTHTHS